tara:strand:+ start:4858 stop:5874 length:1017 start_codon:yes stop_codon:yes gene_type:complete
MIPNSQVNRILVTGGMGFIGSSFLLKCCKKFSNIEFINVDNLSYSFSPKTQEELNLHQNYSFLQTDICDIGELEDIFKNNDIDMIVHFAAESHVDNSIEAPLQFINTNILGTFNLLSIVKKQLENGKSINFHHISTDEVYGSLNEKEPSFTEISNFAPSSPYSASKASSDLLVEAWGKTYGLKYLITNCSNNFGPRQFSEKLIPKVIHNCMNKEKIPIYGSGSNVRDWLYVDDHIDAILSLYENDLFINDRFNIGGGHEVSNIELVKIILGILDKDHGFTNSEILIEHVEDRKGHDFRYSIDNSKLINATGWRPLSSFHEQLRTTINWYVENKNWWIK